MSNDAFGSGTRLDDIKSVAATLGKLDNGAALVSLAMRSGMWTESLHTKQWVRPAFNTNLGNLTPPELSNSFALWTSEFGRLCEIMGHLTAHRDRLKLQAKATRAAARARLRREAANSEQGKAATSAAINDAAEEDPAVLDSDAELGSVETLIAVVSATKEATQAYLQTISREIAFRETQAKTRM